MADTKGAPSGISVDLATALAEALHRKLEIQNLPFDGLIPSLKTGKIDIILSSMTATSERAKAIDFSDPYLKTGLCLLIPKNSPVTSIKELDLAKNVIAVKQGTTGQLYATKNVHSAKLLVLDRESACVLEVVQGKANAFIYDQMSILKHWQQNPDTTQAILTPIQEECWAIGLQKGNNELREKINTFLNDFRNKGGFNALGEKWLTEQQQQFKKLGIPFIF
ncbi:MAG: transporter substrate-binding domain-containing protein [Verrucomicrobiota bacterium]